MSPKEAYLLRETIELLRKEARKSFKGDWRDVDDWIFSELHFSKGELRDIFGGDPNIDFSSALEEPLADPCNDRRWIATDDTQRLRWMGGRTFKVIDMMEVGDKVYRVIESIVDVEARLRDNWSEIESYLAAYDYKGINDVREQYKEFADQIIAECIAETEFSEGEVLLSGSEAECKNFMDFYAPFAN